MCRYTLNMTLEIDGQRHEPDQLVRLVQNHIPGALFVRSAAAEVSMRLPMDSTALFADMLDDLEAHKPSLGLSYYSISMPSLVCCQSLLFLCAQKRALLCECLLYVGTIYFGISSTFSERGIGQG